ncbi:MAG: EFR1 family ferrodoxin [Bacilli bacterium]
MVGIYFSGTGNSKHCLTFLLSLLDEKASSLPMEDKKAVEEISKEDTVYISYPTQFSNAPLYVRDFVWNNSVLWKNKKVFLINTMGAFSGDGTGCLARILKKLGAVILGGVQIRMPDSVADSKALKKSLSQNQEIVKKADRRIEGIAKNIQEGRYPLEGLGFIAHLKGLFGQRLWFYSKTTHYSDKVKINSSCIGCGLCARNCPMKNLEIVDGKARRKNRCTMCYRCVSTCPKKAITILGKKVVEQCRYDKYSSEN